MTAITEITDVAAAVLLRGEPAAPEFLLAQRPPGKVYAGYWEFPGGKVEAGEDARQALCRELREELGIDVRQAWPWICRQFVYPHATVRLKFFRVTAWDGEIAPIEHSGFTWAPVGEAAKVAPILPANDPILRAIALPACYALTHAEANGPENELARLRRALADGARLIQVRDKSLPPARRRDFAAATMALAREYPSTRVLINDDPELARALGASGVHLSSRQLWRVERRPDFDCVAASCHTAADLARAAELALDFAVLGPVLPTASHPGLPGIGWSRFAQLVDRSPLPVYALGGMDAAVLDQARASGAHGIAQLRGWH